MPCRKNPSRAEFKTLRKTRPLAAGDSIRDTAGSIRSDQYLGLQNPDINQFFSRQPLKVFHGYSQFTDLVK